MSIDEIVKEVRKNINKSIVKNRQLLNEKWSYSSDVEEESDKIIETIQQDFLKSKFEKITNDILLFVGEINNYIIFNYKITIQYYVYNCRNLEIIDYLYHGGAYYQNGFIEDENVLLITLYAFNNELQNEVTKKIIVHEVEHIMQLVYGQTSDEKQKSLVNNIYKLANKVLQNSNTFSKTDNIIAKSIYYANPHEQDAFIQEYYQELKKNRFKKVLCNSELHSILENFTYCYDFILNRCSDSDLIKYKIYGVTKNNLVKYIAKQIKRLERKMKNVEKHFPLNKDNIIR